jgi:hypothetical protein
MPDISDFMRYREYPIEKVPHQGSDDLQCEVEGCSHETLRTFCFPCTINGDAKRHASVQEARLIVEEEAIQDAPASLRSPDGEGNPDQPWDPISPHGIILPARV